MLHIRFDVWMMNDELGTVKRKLDDAERQLGGRDRSGRDGYTTPPYSYMDTPQSSSRKRPRSEFHGGNGYMGSPSDGRGRR